MRGAWLGAFLVLATALVGCSASRGDHDVDEGTSEGELAATKDRAWFYDGPIPALADANVTLSLKGHTARVTGYAPLGTDLSGLPHVRTRYEAGRLRVDAVYPIATARPGKSNSPAGLYHFQMAKPYRPDGIAVTKVEGEHWVPWGGYPFVAYNGGIAFHGPITSVDAPELADNEDGKVWVLQRGPVSGGCNRMLPEHIVEFTHVIGVSMRKVYDANRAYPANTATSVSVIDDYDTFDGKYVDVDYPTWTGMKRPGVVYGAGQVEMFGSWVATETPDGSDLPPSMKWEGGVAGKYYVFGEHAREDMVCSVAKADVAKLKALAKTLPGAELPRGFCAKRDCVIDAFHAGRNARAACAL